MAFGHRPDRETSLLEIEMFHDPGECHMSDPMFVHHKRWHSVSFEELQKESPNFQRADLTEFNLLSLLIQILIVSSRGECVLPPRKNINL